MMENPLLLKQKKAKRLAAVLSPEPVNNIGDGITKAGTAIARAMMKKDPKKMLTAKILFGK